MFIVNLYLSESLDYRRTSTQIIFYRGDTYRSRRCTYITINEDDILEYNEVFNVVITENSGKLTIPPGRNVTRITIREDNDCNRSKIIVDINNLLSYLSFISCDCWFSNP